MHRFLLLSLLAIALTLPALAQDDGPYVYATYLECDPAGGADVDAARDAYVPALDAHVAGGDIQAWGWKTHHTGGHWNRMSYFVAPTLDGLMAFQDAWQAEIGRDHPAARDALRSACRSHDDYIFRVVAASRARNEVGGDRSATDVSTLFRCSQGGLDRADALVEEAFAPVLDALVREGAIASWGWLAHVMGGDFTRLLVLDGETHAANLRALDLLGDRVEERVNDEFDALCPSHQDYLWNVRSSR
jgi:hypothetical protein